MDKAIFLGMNGQTSSMHQLEILTNNLANVSTPGFRSDYEVMKQNPVNDDPDNTRIYSSIGQTYTDFTEGSLNYTGNELDVAIEGKGFFTVQAKNGQEACTRAGNFKLSSDGFLVTQGGEIVLGDGGAIQIGEVSKIEISKDGMISAIPFGSDEMVEFGMLRLTNPNIKTLNKGADGLFYSTTGNLPESDEIRVVSKTLESSNVNPIDTLTRLIDLSRNYEMESNFVRNMADIADSANRLLEL